MKSSLLRGAFRVLLAAAAGFGLATCAPGGAIEVAQRVVDVNAQLRVRFDDAALFCDLRLMPEPFRLRPEPVATIGDSALYAYALTNRRGVESPTITTGPHAGETVQQDGNMEANACRSMTSIQSGPVATDGSGSSPFDGFCRADFNYCLGMELSLHAQSLPTGSAQTRLKAALLRVARERLQAAGLEYLASLSFYDRACIAEPDSTYASECGPARLGGGYHDVAHDRMVESVSRIVSLAQTEAGLRADLGDRELRETPIDDTAAVQALYGPDGSRASAVAVFYGPPDGVAFETDWNVRRLRPVAIPNYLPRDENAARALELLRRYRAPTPFWRDTNGAIGLVSTASPAAFYNVLDHRIAAERFLPPYELTEPPDLLAPRATRLRSRRPLSLSEANSIASDTLLPTPNSVLFSKEELTPLDVLSGIILLADAYETQFGSFIFEPQIYLDEDPDQTGPHYLGLAEATAKMRPPEMVAAAFADEDGPISADPNRPLVGWIPRDATSQPPRDWYAWDLRRIDGSQVNGVGHDVAAPMGAAGALHLLRVHLLRLATIESELLDPQKLGQALDLIEHAVGVVWTEYDDKGDVGCQCLEPPNLPPVCINRDEQALYLPCTACALCQLQTTPPELTVPRWDLYYPSELDEAFAGGAPVAVHHVDDVRCLVDARRPGSTEPCDLAPSPLTQVGSSLTARIGRTRRSFQLPTPPIEASHHYLLWRDSGNRYRLLDVVPVDRSVGVHPLGGVFLQAAASAWSWDPWRPGRPSISAAGFPRGLVPPLESELTSDGDGYEDSFATYLGDARYAVALAADQLAQSREDELLARQNELSNATRLEEAELVETAALADMCGGLPGCRVERMDPLTLQDLGLVGEPPPEPGDLGPDGPYDDCDEVLEHLFSDFTETIADGFPEVDDAKTFVESHLSRALDCTMHQYMSELASLRISGLPRPVYEELLRAGSGEFTTYRGEVRERLIEIFHALAGVKSDVARINSHREATSILIQAAAIHVDFQQADAAEQDLCMWGNGLGLLSDIASVGAAVASAYNSFDQASGSFGRATEVSSSGGAGSEKAHSIYGQGLEQTGTGLSHAGRGLGYGASIAGRSAQFALNQCANQDAAVSAGFRGAQQVAESLQAIRTFAIGAQVSARSTYFTIADIDDLERRAHLESRRREITRMQIRSDSLADLPEWHSLRSFRGRRAQAALLRAQQAVFVARRAIEFRLGVDLSSMDQPEPLTPAPSTWADSLFDLGTAVFSVPDTEAEVSTAAEELETYLSRLDRFVQGYPLARRFQDSGDLQVLDLAALLGGDPNLPATEHMLFKCYGFPYPLPAGRLPDIGDPDDPPCTGGDPNQEDTIDLGGVEYAEVSFAIPAEVEGYTADRLAARSFNYRHAQIAINLVGTGVLDCESAFDPAECYSDGNLPYVMRHRGPFVVENFDNELHSFLMEPGVIRGGRVLVAERTLTTPLSSADRALMAPYLRQELRGRPISGLYTLRIEGRPEVRWSHLERIQVLLDYRYWTRQR